MVGVEKDCAHPNCSKGPSYGIADSKRAEMCSQDAVTGMVVVRSKRGVYPHCSKRVYYGMAGKRADMYNTLITLWMVWCRSTAACLLSARGSGRGSGDSIARCGGSDEPWKRSESPPSRAEASSAGGSERGRSDVSVPEVPVRIETAASDARIYGNADVDVLMMKRRNRGEEVGEGRDHDPVRSGGVLNRSIEGRLTPHASRYCIAHGESDDLFGLIDSLVGGRRVVCLLHGRDKSGAKLVRLDALAA